MNDNITPGYQLGGYLTVKYKDELMHRVLKPGDMHCYIVLEGKRGSSWTSLRSSLLRVGGHPGHLVADDDIQLPDYLAKVKPLVGSFLVSLQWLLDEHYSQYVDQERERGHRFQIWFNDRNQPELRFRIENDDLYESKSNAKE